MMPRDLPKISTTFECTTVTKARMALGGEPAGDQTGLRANLSLGVGGYSKKRNCYKKSRKNTLQWLALKLEAPHKCGDVKIALRFNLVLRKKRGD
jgi:hypothetical protein